MKHTRTVVLLLAGLCLLAVPGRADAYIGPGAGITVLGTVVAFFAAIFFAIVGFVWYPIKRLLRVLKSKNAGREEDQPAIP